MNKRIVNLAVALATLLALFIGAVGVSADKGFPPVSSSGPSAPGGPLTGGPLSTGGPDAFGYTWTDTISGGVTYSWDEISGTGTALPVGDDTVSGAIPLPFTFSYYGANYSNIYIGSNGFLTVLAGQSAGCCDGLALPDAGSPNGIIAGYWADLFTAAGGTVYYETLGVAPTRRFVVEWSGVPYFWEAGDSATFEIKLFEGSNNIEVHYVGNSVYDTHTISMGIEDTTGTIGLNYAFGNYGVISGAILYTPVPHVGLSTTSLAFGYQEVGTTSAPLPVVVTNTGSAPLTIPSLSWGGPPFDYPSPDTCTGATLAPAATCTFSYTFSPTVPGYQSDTVSIWSNASTSPDTVGLSGNGFVPITAAFISVKTEDGHATEAGEFGGVGLSSSASGGYIMVGDWSADKQVKGFLSFDTSSLPDGAVVVRSHIELRLIGVAGTNPFITHGALNVDIANPSFGALALSPSDFQAVSTANDVAVCDTALGIGWFDCDLVSSLGDINRLGSTQFRLWFDLDDNDDRRPDYLKIASGNNPKAIYHPVLVVEYYVP